MDEPAPGVYGLSEKKKVRVALYARVSTDLGEQDPTQQLAVLRREAAHREWEVVFEGADMQTGDSELWERKEGSRLWQAVKRGEVDAVMTYDASRLSREHPRAVFDLLDKLERKYGVAYVSATERFFDTSTDNDFRDLVVGIIAWANNYYLKQLKRSTLRGKAASRARGTPQGRHAANCGIAFPCPTGAHEQGTGRSMRPKLKKRRYDPLWSHLAEKASLGESPPMQEGGLGLASGPSGTGA